MAYCSDKCVCVEETPEQKIIRKKDREIELLKNVIADQAKRLLDDKISYEEIVDRNQELRDSLTELRIETNNMFAKSYRIKELLRLAKDAYENAKSQRQRDVSKIRVELLQDVIDILEGNEDEDIKTGTDTLKK